MAGSYNHIVTNHGNLVSNERFVQMVENLGDAYETVEEMYGMIWWLAYSGDFDEDPVATVEEAHQKYKDGLKLAKANKFKRGSNGS